MTLATHNGSKPDQTGSSAALDQAAPTRPRPAVQDRPAPVPNGTRPVPDAGAVGRPFPAVPGRDGTPRGTLAGRDVPGNGTAVGRTAVVDVPAGRDATRDGTPNRDDRQSGTAGTPRRVEGRTAAWLAFLLGTVVSVAANVMHTWYPTPTGPTAEQLAAWLAISATHTPENWHPSIGAQIAGAFWPLAVLFTIEMMARIRWPQGWFWALARYGGTGIVAIVAAVISYQHMSALLRAYGETGIAATVGPLAVDGLMIVASVALLATGGKHHGPAGRPRYTAAASIGALLVVLPAAEQAPRPPRPPAEQAPRPRPAKGSQARTGRRSGGESPAFRAAIDACKTAIAAGQKSPGHIQLRKDHPGLTERQARKAPKQARRELAAANGHTGAGVGRG